MLFRSVSQSRYQSETQTGHEETTHDGNNNRTKQDNKTKHGAGWQNVATGVKAEKNLAWADYAGNGLTAEGWRQALVTIEPQTGQMLTSISLGVTAGSGWRVSGLLDVQISAPSATTLVFEDYWNGSGQKHRWCERVGVQATSLLSLDRLFQGMAGLVKVEGTSWTSLAANTSNMFNSCSSLREVPLFDLSACTNTSNMFSSCSSLREVPLFNHLRPPTFMLVGV